MTNDTNEAPTESMFGKDRLTTHNYDDIQEYDNPTPSWWHLIFLASMVFAAFYFFMSVASPMFPRPDNQVAAAEQRHFKQLFGDVGELEPDTQTLLTMMDDPQWLALATGLFGTHCISCHAAGGKGQVGPNLTDDYWKNLTSVEEIYQVISNGAANGAMPAWSNRLSNNERVLLASYVASLRGSKPPGGKSPEGDPIPPWPTVEHTDPPASTSARAD